MPGLTGLELIGKVKTTLPDMDITFIILSGYAEFSFASQAMKYGVKYYLLKPTDVQDIVSTLEKVISERKEKNVSHNKVTSMFNRITSKVLDGKLEDTGEELDKLFQVLEDCDENGNNINYCVELFIRIIRQCKDFQQIPRYLKMSTEIHMDTPLVEVHGLIFKTIAEIININESINSHKYSKSIRSALDYIDENISNEDLSLASLAKNLYMNSDYLGKLFKKELNENFNDYLTNLRVKMAQELIQSDNNNKIGDIAEKVGFGCNSQYFSQVFKKYTGYTPKEYKTLHSRIKTG
jgi:two-component system response regulator YesN